MFTVRVRVGLLFRAPLHTSVRRYSTEAEATIRKPVEKYALLQPFIYQRRGRSGLGVATVLQEPVRK